MKIDRLTPALGAEIDIDLGNITGDCALAVYDALMAHQVVFFRDQQMTPEQHIERPAHRSNGPVLNAFLSRKLQRQ